MIPIQVHPLFLLVAFFMGLLMAGGDLGFAFLITLIITVSILVHEFGHALTGIAFHQKVKISLLPFGGLTERQGKPLKGWQDFLIVLMGPAFGFMLYVIASWLLTLYPAGIFGKVFLVTAIINLYWTILNLLPVLPLDGGQLMRVVLQGIWGIKGLKAACILSLALGAFFAVAMLLKQEILIGSIFAIFTYESWRLYSDVQHLTDSDTDVSFQRLLNKGERAYEKGDIEKAREVFLEVRQKVQGGALFNLATLRLAEMNFSNSQYQDGYNLLEPIKKELTLDGLALFQELSYRTAHWADALFAGTKVAQAAPSAEIALQNARASGELGDPNGEEGWMKLYRKMKN